MDAAWKRVGVLRCVCGRAGAKSYPRFLGGAPWHGLAGCGCVPVRVRCGATAFLQGCAVAWAGGLRHGFWVRCVATAFPWGCVRFVWQIISISSRASLILCDVYGWQRYITLRMRLALSRESMLSRCALVVAIFLLWLLLFYVLERMCLPLSFLSSYTSYVWRCGVQNALSIYAFVEWSSSLRLFS